MKKIIARIAICLIFSCFLCLSISVSAENASENQYSIAMVTKLQKYLKSESSDITANYDINSDKIINAKDLTLLKRHLIYKSPAVSTTTVKPVVTTTKTVTTTAKAITTTIKPVTTTVKPVVTTVKPVTTTAKTVTTTVKPVTTMTKPIITTAMSVTTTAKPVTTTVKSTTTVSQTTFLTTTTATISTKAGYSVIEKSIHNISLTDTTVPAYNGELSEASDGVFLFKSGSKTYAYSLLSEQALPSASLLSDISLIKGAHIWIYNGKQKPVSVFENLPDTTDLTFHVDDPTTSETEFEYELKEYSSISYTDITRIAKIIYQKKAQYASDIGVFDYNLNGLLDSGDVDIMIKYFSSEPHNFFWRLNDDAFNRYINNLPLLGNTNDVLIKTTSTEPVIYAYNIPTADLVKNSTNKSVFVPVQILPNTFTNDLSKLPELSTISDDTADYYAWVSTQQSWAKVSLTSQNWKFQAGFYVYSLDNSGNYRYEWIH